jgi:predicted AAA+ superfamily ATPase
METTLIERPAYLKALNNSFHTPEIKVLTGVRRGGKSSILRLFSERLVKEGIAPKNIFFKRLDAFDTPLNYSAQTLYDELASAIAASDRDEWFYVFLDEIQVVDGWQNVVRRLHTRERTDVYITGSNAKVLSGELATFLTGRYLEIPVFPLSFTEYQDFIAHRPAGETTPAPTLMDYLRFGGMPGIFALNSMNEAEIRSLLETVYESILFSDVASRMELRSTPSLERVARFILGTTGNLFSLRNVVNTLKSSGITLDIKTVDTLIAGLLESYVIYEVEQHGIQGKQVLRPQRKYYPVDTGLRSLASGFGTVDIGARLEGAVLIELKRRGYTSSVGTLRNSEIDFVAVRGSERLYIQVSESLSDPSTRKRELSPLESLANAYPRMVLTTDTLISGTTPDGIRIVNVERWLAHEA